MAAETPPGMAEEREFARETRIRDLYAERLARYRPNERLLRTESGFSGSRKRADMRTVDSNNLIRVYEFELVAVYEGLGQALVYLAMARRELGLERRVQGVLAAFRFESEVWQTVEILNLGLELLILPPELARAGGVPTGVSKLSLPKFPSL